jgi:hypothetical protein
MRAISSKLLVPAAVLTLSALFVLSAAPAGAVSSAGHHFNGQLCGILSVKQLSAVGIPKSERCVQLKASKVGADTHYNATWGMSATNPGVRHFLAITVTSPDKSYTTGLESNTNGKKLKIGKWAMIVYSTGTASVEVVAADGYSVVVNLGHPVTSESQQAKQVGPGMISIAKSLAPKL